MSCILFLIIQGFSFLIRKRTKKYLTSDFWVAFVGLPTSILIFIVIYETKSIYLVKLSRDIAL